MPIPETPVKRADARRNIETIVAVATRLLAADPDTSMQQIADSAGVGRVTVYAHFPSRAALVTEVANRAITQTNAELEALDLEGDPLSALTRLLEATWRLAYRHGAILSAADRTMDPDELHRSHAEPARRVRIILERGRAHGDIRSDMPTDWQIETIHAVLHGALEAVRRGVIARDDAPRLLVTTILAAIVWHTHD